MRAAQATLAFLAACAAPEPDQPPLPVFRDVTAVIGSQTNVSADDLAGRWVPRVTMLRSGLGFGDGPTVAVDGTGLRITHEGFVEAGEGMIGAQVFETVYLADGPGRWRLADAQLQLAGLSSAPERLWVFWIDGDRRTMAIGDPDGTFAQVLDRAATGGGDRIAAAREILDWYGYDLSEMVEN